jgi:hypothetical protein
MCGAVLSFKGALLAIVGATGAAKLNPTIWIAFQLAVLLIMLVCTLAVGNIVARVAG